MVEIDEPGASCRSLQPCGHRFHAECIHRWLSCCAEVNSGRRLGRAGLLSTLSCPNCRARPELSEDEARELFPDETLAELDATPRASPELAFLSEVVRRVQQA